VNHYSPKVRLKDIAEKAGLSVAAVSMALKNHRSLPQVTIDRVKQLAEELHYVPDPALSALAAHRSRLRVSKDFSVIGIVSNWSSQDGWRHLKSAKEVIEGANARAIELGKSLILEVLEDLFWHRSNATKIAWIWTGTNSRS
jgi:LacI family transcriptional regulator